MEVIIDTRKQVTNNNIKCLMKVLGQRSTGGMQIILTKDIPLFGYQHLSSICSSIRTEIFGIKVEQLCVQQ